MQHFENNVHTETNPHLDVHAIDPLLPHGLLEDPPAFGAWSQGNTGFPIIDATMCQLLELGWINMRMRGMLACFAVGTLGIDWRTAGLHLAREFLDYEPAIHWNQMQIHSGTSALSPALSYNPIKQSQDHHPDGTYIRRWVPSLQTVPTPYIHQPWTMPLDVQQSCGCIIGMHYPHPIVYVFVSIFC